MTANNLISILKDYVRSYGDQFIVVSDNNSVLGDADSVILTDDGDFAINFNYDNL